MTTNGSGGIGGGGPSGNPGGVEVLLERFVAVTPGAQHALVLSADGLKVSWSPGLSADRADQLAAIASGIQSLVHGASLEFGDGSGGVRQSMTDFHGGVLFIVAAGAGAHLAVVGEESADARAIGRGMNDVVEAVHGRLGVRPATGALGKLPA
ncbi:Predicted regulator of Ras-like GTPase activity, Roadblock/LC7/MglB family [Actinacidiphila yanglinensis]|uniref:Predicted regulator of Ras-like GTPase activity, Roadblock/LC7/MglB family n=1 Tax=Actinacidiphila yanglinensis TaxID=310779 RepID=A0A1H6A1P7_9ACTN|nr:roadblock/LC7 domain-containing protein [Actinacidiphila yanglinensis]SEG42659.1 Predicted regulator of Ras-like GTPase activity, Roadblock/LC7/MglB family [Actinacidiphila yanglinensis]